MPLAELFANGQVPHFAWLAIRWAPGQATASEVAARLCLTLRLRSRYGLGPPKLTDQKPVKVALIQESFDTEFTDDPTREDRIHQAYLRRSVEAKRAHPDLDLIVWPETMFGATVVEFAPDATVPPDLQQRYPELTAKVFRHYLSENAQRFDQRVQETAEAIDTPILFGVAAQEYGTDGNVRRFNSAVFVNADRQPEMRYDKMHPVMFGEYVPLGNWLPWLYQLTPMSGGIDSGTSAQSFDIGGLRFCPNICFEGVLPHLVRQQVNQLRAQGTEPDVLVSVTNDGWFHGSSELKLHLICNVFRAVEHRKPMIVAANTGISAWIDASGRVQSQGPRQGEATLVALVTSHQQETFYSRYGDWFAGICLAVVVGIYLLAVTQWWRGRKSQAIV